MKQQVFSLVTFIIILSWPIAGQAQAQFARNAAKVSKSLKHPAVAAAATKGLYSVNSQRNEISRHVALSNNRPSAMMFVPTANTLVPTTQSFLDKDSLKPVAFNPDSILYSLQKKKIKMVDDSLFTIAK